MTSIVTNLIITTCKIMSSIRACVQCFESRSQRGMRRLKKEGGQGARPAPFKLSQGTKEVA